MSETNNRITKLLNQLSSEFPVNKPNKEYNKHTLR